MPQKQTWPLSQEANKSNGICSYCFAVRQLHLKDGTVHKHGPHHSPCPGSHKPPVDPSQVPQGQGSPSTSSATPRDNNNNNSAPPVINLATDASQPTPSFQLQHPAHISIIKRIPKSARPACCKHLSEIIRKVSRDTSDLDAWSALLGFGQHILRQPPRGGK